MAGQNKSISGNCKKCGTYRETLHCDRIVPKWNGGSDDESNRQRLCANCHEDKTLAEHRSADYRTKVGALMRGLKWTPEQCAAQSARQRGKKRGPYPNKKGPLSEEQRAKMRASWTPERRQQVSLRTTGRKFGPCPDERKAKISAAMAALRSAAQRRKASHSDKDSPRLC